MKNLKSKLCALTLLVLSQSTFAVTSDTLVDEDDYEKMNFFVNIITINDDASDEICGGQLIAGKWILTARHCVIVDNPSSDDEAVDEGESITLDVYQGVGGYRGYSDGNSRLVYSGTGTYYSSSSADIITALTDDLSDTSIIYDLSDLDISNNTNISSITAQTYKTLVSLDEAEASDAVFDTTNADLVLIELDNTVAYQNTLKIGMAADLDDLDNDTPKNLTGDDGVDAWLETQSIYENQTLTFYGWGQDDGVSVSTMQQAEIEIYSQPVNPFYEFFTTEGETVAKDDFEADDYDVDPNGTGVTAVAYLTFGVTNAVKSDSDALGSGDSGTALITSTSDGDYTAYAIARAVSTTSTTDSYTAFVGLKDWMLDTIDALNVPEEVEYLVSDSVETVTIDVQNLSSDTKILNLDSANNYGFVEGTIDDLDLDVSDCPTSLDSLESCSVVATFTASNVEADDYFTISFDDDTSTTVTFVDSYSESDSSDTIYDLSDDSDDDSDDDASTSSGGSTGLFSLISMCLLAFGKQRYAKKAQ